MYQVSDALRLVRDMPSEFVIVHYSSQSLFDEVENAYSPRITSIVVMFFETRQTANFSLHSIAEELDVQREKVEECYDRIELELLERFFQFSKSHFGKCWLHWNMRNTVFGFEHLEHRYRVLSKKNPPTIPYDNRLNISDILKYKYGPDYAPDPRMLKLMELNGRRDPRFLTGAEEASAFKRMEFIRMNSSTISKVEFFRYVVDRASKGKLRTSGSNIQVRIDRALESTLARTVAFISALVGLPLGLWGIYTLF